MSEELGEIDRDLAELIKFQKQKEQKEKTAAIKPEKTVKGK